VDTAWLKTEDGCFISEKEQTGGEKTKLILERCQSVPLHWVGVLKLDQRPYCYDEPTVDSASHKQEPTAQQVGLATEPGITELPGAVYLDLGCMVRGIPPPLDTSDQWVSLDDRKFEGIMLIVVNSDSGTAVPKKQMGVIVTFLTLTLIKGGSLVSIQTPRLIYLCL
jgi:hypothetical protein